MVPHIIKRASDSLSRQLSLHKIEMVKGYVRHPLLQITTLSTHNYLLSSNTLDSKVVNAP